MSVIRIQGMRSLQGEMEIQGSKNAVLPVMAAALLHEGRIVIKNIPRIQDVFCMIEILEALGCGCRLEGHELAIDTRGLCKSQVPDEAGGRMRSSIMLLGPLLGRLHQAETCYPGGCVIGRRPIDLHLAALQQMGAEICSEGETIQAFAGNLQGAKLSLPFPSVGATENALMAAVAARGITCIRGAAREPEIEVLCRFCESMGARIEGIGSSFLTVYGGRKLHDCEFTVPGDRIVAGTYLGALAATGGELCLRGVPATHMAGTWEALRQTGCVCEFGPDRICARMDGRPQPVNLSTGPYPEFPTDLQSVMLAVASVAEGYSQIQENIFEERFATAEELKKIGAHITIEGGSAYVMGSYPLAGGELWASDLRGGAALVVAGLASENESRIHGYSYISRGYEDICGDLTALGARIALEED
ncbi:MAG: UDP-N-acetylglucosamine 1-carboxyvinyltransferase [Lachnospiraceae bacterium]|nr:UDP-N-acetylglucosamine 1-carboxyvinyltransferase [Lachnospiraceae bacterium]